ncbi:hypothetical protein AB6A40_003700 [Gnathostoma spinigerum]|uniref:ShKT domain-containing protein n=1 Tax=Gnathostoma spinigerum TaxID=75299 RepID=A0ABD6EHX7_9BILA
MRTLVLTAAWLFVLIVITTAEECRDENESCKVWADAGHCEINPSYMKTYCKKSCKVCTSGGGEIQNQGDCKDSDKNCKAWAKSGECEKNPTWMLANCKKSCKQCGGSGSDRSKPKKPNVGGGDLPDVGDINCGGSMTNEVRTLLVNGHNKRRSDMAQGRMVTLKSKAVSSGSNVQAFTWDCELERKSEEWAQYCSTHHSPNREDRSENLYWEGGYPVRNAKEVANNSMYAWWEEENDERGFGNPPYTDWYGISGNRHLITMAWAESNKMGCFVKTDCPDMRYVVCQYKVRGNWRGDPVMKVGPPCSECPSGTACHQKSGLCVSS